MSIDLPGALAGVVGDAGEVGQVYGGFQVAVNDGDKFPWQRTFEFLLAIQHDVWVTSRDGRLLILSKPPPV